MPPSRQTRRCSARRLLLPCIGALIILVAASNPLYLYLLSPPVLTAVRLPAKVARVLHDRPPGAFVQRALDGRPLPPGAGARQFMYDCFKRDVRELEFNSSLPRHAVGLGKLRVVSFNVHFFRTGYAGVVGGDSYDETLRLVRELNADVYLLQEVPRSLVPSLRRRLAELGLTHAVAAGSGDAHVRDPKSKAFPGERLHVLVASRHRFVRSEAVPMEEGHAAYAEIVLDGIRAEVRPDTPPTTEVGRAGEVGEGGATVRVYSVHLSTRCRASKRAAEIRALLEHVRAGEAGSLTLIGGDFNQPNEADYPPAEWRAILADMRRAGLPANDGVRSELRSAGFVTTYESSGLLRPLPPTTAWNGAIVDYIYTNRKGEVGQVRNRRKKA